jgi:uncharacterized protein YigE (DUF2233 family)
MKNRFVYFVIALVTGCFCHAQTSGDNQYIYHGHTYGIFTIKIDTGSIKIFKLVQNLTGIPHNDFVAPYVNSDPNIFITNACMWDSANNPIGLFVADGQTVHPLNLNDGNQLGFYLKPNGVLLFTDKDVQIVESSQASSVSNVTLATQSGPMLVIDGSIHPKFDPKSKNKNYRCGVGCKNALCLQNAGCAMYSPFINRKNPIENRAIATYLMYTNH